MSTAKSNTCRICAIASGHYALGEVDRPWLENDSYMVFASVGALVEGWSLAVPKRHCLNLLGDYSDARFTEFVRDAVSTVQSAYGSAVVFEHGGQSEHSSTSCGTSHAHLHIVPIKFSLQQAAVAFDDELRWLQCSLKNLKGLVGNQEYLFVADRYEGVDTKGDVCLLKKGQSQFFRRVIADQLGRTDESNYRTHPNLHTAEAGSDVLRSLSSRLKAA